MCPPGAPSRRRGHTCSGPPGGRRTPGEGRGNCCRARGREGGGGEEGRIIIAELEEGGEEEGRIIVELEGGKGGEEGRIIIAELEGGREGERRIILQS